jgi:hypothetical protein
MLACVVLYYSAVTSDSIACGGKSSVSLNLLLDETHISVFLRHVGPTIKNSNNNDYKYTYYI